MASILEAPIQNIKYFGPAAAKKLAKLKIKTVRDLLYHFPYRYEDFSSFTPIGDIASGDSITAKGTVIKAKNINIFRRRMTLTEIVIEDETGAIKSVWFNQPYLLSQLKIGRTVNLSGKVVLNKNRLCFSNPAYEIISYGENKNNKSEAIHTGRLVPVYPETSGFTSRWLRLGIRPLLKLTGQIPDILPAEAKKKFHLPDLDYAFGQIHFPESIEKADFARRRFAFEELLVLQIFMGLERMKLAAKKSPRIDFDEKAARKFVGSLPYKLTDDQKKSAWQIIRDLGKNRPMNRLLEGDVGSGKTVIAAMAAYLAAIRGFQTAFMAPTEILSRQHYEKIQPMLQKFGVPTGLLTSSEAKTADGKITKKNFIKKIEEGGIKVVIGTHSLIQKNVEFNNLALVVIDEQHRFGVGQRATLADHRGKELIPHLLSMSATPIPRTLGLTVWGDLDLSLIKEMPKGRKNIITKIIPPEKRIWAYDFIKSEVAKGRQVFIICPLIETSEKLSKRSLEGIEIKSAKAEYERLGEKIFPKLKLGLVHGRMKPKEKEKVMAEFLDRKIDILVSTSVVEVGIDIPNAAVMMIEGSDRFGLASLYQFRGRVGRGEHQSYCFLLTDSFSAKTNERLKAIESARSGFDLAEKDLALRGPGDFAGIRQSGLPDLTIASLTDMKLIEETREAAREILNTDPNLKSHPPLQAKMAEFKNKIHLE